VRFIAPASHYILVRATRLVLVFLLTGILSGAQTKSGERSAVARTGRPATTTASTASDADLERRIRERFARSKSAADKFQVLVRNGVATIEGRTDVIQRKAAATRMAKSAGAKQVVNKIEVSDKAREAASQNLTTGRRRAQVKRSDPRTEPRR
jgi:osmotically-inducible protein OsmY